MNFVMMFGLKTTICTRNLKKKSYVRQRTGFPLLRLSHICFCRCFILIRGTRGGGSLLGTQGRLQKYQIRNQKYKIDGGSLCLCRLVNKGIEIRKDQPLLHYNNRVCLSSNTLHSKLSLD